MGVTFQEIRDLDELAKHRQEWDCLCQQSPQGDLFHTFDWVTTWVGAFWRDKPLQFLLIDDMNQLVGCLPLLCDVHGELWCPKSLVTPINAHSTRTSMLASVDRRELMAEMLNHLRSIMPELRIGFPRLQDNSWMLSHIRSCLTGTDLAVATMNQPASPFIDLSMGEHAYFAALSSHLRHEVRRKEQRLTRSGTVKVMTITTLEECDQAMSDVLEIERNSWKHEAGSAFTSMAAVGCFYEALARKAATNDWLRLYLLYLDEEPIAHIYALAYKNICYAIKTSYHEAYRNLAPGCVLFMSAVRDAFAEGFARIDLLGEESPWKSELANGRQGHVDVCIFSTAQTRCRLCRQYEQNVKPFIKQNLPFLVKMKHALLAQ